MILYRTGLKGVGRDNALAAALSVVLCVSRVASTAFPRLSLSVSQGSGCPKGQLTASQLDCRLPLYRFRGSTSIARTIDASFQSIHRPLGRAMVHSTASSAPVIAVLGATGNQGGSVVKYLKESPKPYHIRAVVRDEGKARSLGVSLVKGDLNHPESLKNAFKGAGYVFGVTSALL